MEKRICAQIFLTVVVFAQLEFSSAEYNNVADDYSQSFEDSRLAENWKKSQENALNYFEKLVVNHTIYKMEVKNLKNEPLKPLPTLEEIIEIIHNTPDYIEVKALISKFWPPQRIFKRGTCRKQLEEKVFDKARSILRLINEQYKSTLRSLDNKLDDIKLNLNVLEHVFKLNKQYNLEYCSDDTFCNLVNDYMEDLIDKMKYVGYALTPESNYFDADYKVTDNEGKIQGMFHDVVVPVHRCWDSYWQPNKE